MLVVTGDASFPAEFAMLAAIDFARRLGIAVRYGLFEDPSGFLQRGEAVGCEKLHVEIRIFDVLQSRSRAKLPNDFIAE